MSEQLVCSVFGYEALVAHIIEYVARDSLKEMVDMSLVSRCFRRAVRLCTLNVDFRSSTNDAMLRSLGDLQMHRRQNLDLSECRAGEDFKAFKRL